MFGTLPIRLFLEVPFIEHFSFCLNVDGAKDGLLIFGGSKVKRGLYKVGNAFPVVD